MQQQDQPYNQFNYPQGSRPRIDFFNQRHNGPNDHPVFHNGGGTTLQRPPSRHKDPPMNLGLDFPQDDNPPMDVDDDCDSEDAFEIGIANANKKS